MIKTAKARGIAFRHSGFGIDLSFVIRISSFETTRDPFRTTCEPCNASLYENLASKTGRYRSGQTGQTVNLLALRLRWFESSPAHSSAGAVIRELVSGLFAGHLRGDRHIHRRHRIRRVRRRPRATVALAGGLHSPLMADLRWPDR